MRLRDKVALITGAARGIGLVTAQRFAEEGARLMLGDIDSDAGQAAALRVSDSALKAGSPAPTPTVLFERLDVTDRASVEAFVATAQGHFGKIDILINNAGITADAQLLKMTEDQWQRVLDVNLKGVFLCTQAVAPVMIAQGKGKIVNASSVVALYGNFGQSNYVATKAGLIGMTKVWARELGRKGICVNAVAPGFIETEMVGTIPEKIINRLLEHTPLGRMGKPQEVAHAYVFLASDESDFINGTVLSVDGGLVI
ncbi:MAG: beta-ketoacyl-ACP reductase [Acidobacteriia bacterium]|nr:beta-ketoacyl-ACP reductase [Terriglobia bacterium]